MIKAIFFDIDGTLVPHGWDHMPESTMESLHKLREKGVKLFISTGRTPNTIDHVKKMFTFDGYITSNGQYCFNEKEIIHEQYIELSSLEVLIPYLNDKNVPLVIGCLKENYCNQMMKDNHPTMWEVIDNDEILNKQVVQLMAHIPPTQDDEFLSFLPGCKSARWTDAFADIIPSTGGKEKGIDYILDYYGFTLDEAMCFGDGGNDITMLRHVPCSVAMDNAEDRVKASAFYVTSDVTKDGIYNALKHFNVID